MKKIIILGAFFYLASLGHSYGLEKTDSDMPMRQITTYGDGSVEIVTFDSGGAEARKSCTVECDGYQMECKPCKKCKCHSSKITNPEPEDMAGEE